MSCFDHREVVPWALRGICHAVQILAVGDGRIDCSTRIMTAAFQAAWTDSFCHFRCWHEHPTLIETAKRAMPQGAGWYVMAAEYDTPRELTESEDKLVNEFQFRAN
jgi:hypothetical protein